jgi:hypothetical protein
MLSATTLTQQQLDDALDSVERLERVEISLEGSGFAYRLFGDGRQVLAGVADREQLAPMLLVTEILLNAELGLRGERLCLAGCN